MRHTLTFAGIDLADYGVYYDGSELWRTPEKIIDFYSIPGRSGDVGISQNKYSNITRPFNCCIRSNFRSNFSGLVNALSNVEGYGRLETSEEPDVYMMASFYDEIQPDLGQFNERGIFTLSFNFQPQKWLKSGEEAIEITSEDTLVNPTSQTAFPLILVAGTGTITINDSVLTLAENSSVTTIDCETQDCYEGTINRNSDLTVVGGFPVLGPTNNISVDGCTISIKPRWWRL